MELPGAYPGFQVRGGGAHLMLGISKFVVKINFFTNIYGFKQQIENNRVKIR
jgi:hypothetical protein